MKKKTIILSIGLLLGILAVALFMPDDAPVAQTTLPTAAFMPVKKHTLRASEVENPHLQQFLAEYEAEIRQLLHTTGAPGAAVAIVKDTSVIFLKGFGLRAVGSTDSVDTETVFRLASVSKCFAPVLTGMLVQDSLLGWNDKIIQYVPEFSLKSREQTEKLNLKHILSHTVGLPYHTYTNLVEEGEDLHSMLLKLRDVDMINKVGTVYSYQNVAYSLISEVVLSATGKSYEQLMMERIFQPLHMDHASICYDSISKNHNVALPHKHTRSGMIPTPIHSTYYNVAPAGGVNASVADMAQWIRALLGHRSDVISNRVLDEVFTPVVKAPYKNRNFRKWMRPTGSFYALGWRVLNFEDKTVFYHGGFVNGYRSELAIDRVENVGVCVLTNVAGPFADNAVPIFYKCYEKYQARIHAWAVAHNPALANTTPPPTPEAL
jgi:beta-lactamase class C